MAYTHRGKWAKMVKLIHTTRKSLKTHAALLHSKTNIFDFRVLFSIQLRNPFYSSTIRRHGGQVIQIVNAFDMKTYFDNALMNSREDFEILDQIEMNPLADKYYPQKIEKRFVNKFCNRMKEKIRRVIVPLRPSILYLTKRKSDDPQRFMRSLSPRPPQPPLPSQRLSLSLLSSLSSPPPPQPKPLLAPSPSLQLPRTKPSSLPLDNWTPWENLYPSMEPVPKKYL